MIHRKSSLMGGRRKIITIILQKLMSPENSWVLNPDWLGMGPGPMKSKCCAPTTKCAGSHPFFSSDVRGKYVNKAMILKIACETRQQFFQWESTLSKGRQSVACEDASKEVHENWFLCPDVVFFSTHVGPTIAQVERQTTPLIRQENILRAAFFVCFVFFF